MNDKTRQLIGYLLTLPFLLSVLGAVIFIGYLVWHYNSFITLPVIGFIIGFSITTMFLFGIKSESQDYNYITTAR